MIGKKKQSISKKYFGKPYTKLDLHQVASVNSASRIGVRKVFGNKRR